jgi:ATP-dependent Lon protease
MFMAKNENNGVVTDLKDIHHVGVLGRISSIEFGLPGVRQPQAIINGSYRIQVTAAEPHTSHNKLVVKVEKLKDQPYNPQDRELQAYQAELMLTLREIVSLGQTSYPQLYVDQLSSIMTTSGNRSIGDLCDVAAAAVNSASATDLQAILEASDIKQRIELVLGLLRGELEKLKLIGDIRKKLEESLLQASRQYQLKEQLKIIKKELGLETDEKQVVQDKFTKRLEGKTVPEAAMTVINEEMSKLSTLDPGSSEFNVTKNYLDWLTILPWGVYS